MKYKNKWAVLDIETAPLPEVEIEKWLPDWLDWKPEMFDETTVKTGNIKDPGKIAAKIQESREKSQQEFYQAQAEKRNEIEDKAALHPNTGWVFGIGWADLDGGRCKLTLDQRDEKDILETAWQIVTNTRVLVNHNLLGFDLPFLAARSMKLGVKIPFRIASVTPWSGQKLFLHDNPNPITLLDTMQIAAKFAPSQRPSLNWAAKFFGLEAKIDLDGLLPWDVACKDFDKACRYTERDVVLTAEIAQKMQLL